MLKPGTFDGSVPKSTARLEAELHSLSEGSAGSQYLHGSVTTENPGGRTSKRIKYESKEDLSKTTMVEEVGAQLDINDDEPHESSPMEIGAEQNWMEGDASDNVETAVKKERLE